ncbi:MAG: hypothetical protein ACI4V3_03545 [Faecousia sp.]
MKKTIQTQWCLVALALLISVAGAILRGRQLLYELQPDGSLAAGSSMHIVLPILSGVWLAGAIALLLPLAKKTQWSECFHASVVPNLLQLFAAGMLIVGNVLLWIEGRQPTTAFATQSPAVSEALSAMLAPLGILSAVCIGAFAVFCLRGKRPSPLLYMIASIYLVVRLIVCFQEWNVDPSVHDYAFRLLAAICCMLATFQLAGFSFDRGKRRMSLFWSLSAVVFCSITVADTLLGGVADEALINFGLLLSLGVSSGQLLFTK